MINGLNTENTTAFSNFNFSSDNVNYRFLTHIIIIHNIKQTILRNDVPVQSQARCDTAFHSSETVLISEDWKG